MDKWQRWSDHKKETIRLKPGKNFYIPTQEDATVELVMKRYAIIGDDGNEITPIKDKQDWLPVFVYVNKGTEGRVS